MSLDELCNLASHENIYLDLFTNKNVILINLKYPIYYFGGVELIKEKQLVNKVIL